MTLSRKATGAILVTVLLWASAFPGIRAGLEAYTPGQLALLRYLFASLTLVVCVAVRGARMPRWRDLPVIALLGALGFAVYHVALNYGEQTVTAGAASFLTSTAPVFAALLAATFLGERLSAWGWGGIALSFGGATLIALGEAGGLRFDAGTLLVLLAALSGAGYFTLQKPHLQRYSALELTTYAAWAGTLLMSYYLPGLGTRVLQAPAEATVAIAYIGVFPGALGYVTYAYALARMPVSAATSFLYLVPVAVLPIAWVWLGEVPALTALAGGLLALIGVVLVQKKGKAPRSDERQKTERLRPEEAAA